MNKKILFTILGNLTAVVADKTPPIDSPAIIRFFSLFSLMKSTTQLVKNSWSYLVLTLIEESPNPGSSKR